MTQHNGARTVGVLSPQMLRAAAVVLWMIWLAWLLSGERYKAFIVPQYWPLVAGALLVVAMFAVALLMQSRPVRQASPGLSRRLKAAIFVLMLPLIFAPLAASGRLGGFAFEKRFVGGPNSGPSNGQISGVSTQAALSANSAKIPTPPLPVDRAAAAPVTTEPASMSISMSLPATPITLTQLADSPEKFVNHRVSFDGIVHRDQDVGKGQAWVYRYLITCCAADAQPLAFRVDAPNPSVALDGIEEGVWVHVVGMFRITKTPLGEAESLTAESVKVVDPPARPYLYYVVPTD